MLGTYATRGFEDLVSPVLALPGYLPLMGKWYRYGYLLTVDHEKFFRVRTNVKRLGRTVLTGWQYWLLVSVCAEPVAYDSKAGST